ncbi:MAG TPA: lamin tail domain-containing protein, partial [Pyrinomonadaceae bacterium]
MNKRQPRPAARRQQPSALRRIKNLRLTLSFLLVAFALAGYHFLSTPPPVEALSPNIVISQIYGAGGNVGAIYNQDYIELYNRGATAVNITGWTLQYASAAGNFSTAGTTNALTLSGTINPGQYFLVAASTPPGANGINIPTPDQSINFSMAPGGGKVVLRNTSPGFNGVACPG